MHCSKSSNSATGSCEVLDVLGQRVQLLLELLDAVRRPTPRPPGASASERERAQRAGEEPAHQSTASPGSFWQRAARAVAADEGEEHVVRVVPVAAVDGERGPVGERRRAGAPNR